MADKDFKEPYNIFYFLGFIAVLLIPTLPATLTWIRVMNGYAGFNRTIVYWSPLFVLSVTFSILLVDSA